MVMMIKMVLVMMLIFFDTLLCAHSISKDTASYQHDVYSSRNLSWFGKVCGELHSRVHLESTWSPPSFRPQPNRHQYGN